MVAPGESLFLRKPPRFGENTSGYHLTMKNQTNDVVRVQGLPRNAAGYRSYVKYRRVFLRFFSGKHFVCGA